jgi:predicted 3-demethylubiquinone-9 3-methyltransferase (glyoxalase superfamily)
MISAKPFLMFQGRCEEAMTFYAATLPDTRIVALEHHGPGGAGEEGKVFMARLSVAGLEIMAFDSLPVHAFDFTPSFSIFLEVSDPEEVDRLAAALDGGSRALMPAGDYGFSRRYAWVADQFGITWQINAA